MNLNVNKSAVLHCTSRSQSPHLSDYFMDGKPLSTQEQYQYLGSTIHQSLSWFNHIHNITSKASRALNFIRCNLSKCSKEVKESTYLTLVKPCLEDAACVWDPYLLYHKREIEKVQRRAVIWTLSDYCRYNSVTDNHMLSQLCMWWAILEQRRYIIRLSIFHKILYNNYKIMISLYRYHHTSYQHSSYLQDSITQITLSCLLLTLPGRYQLSYFLRTIKDWNVLFLCHHRKPLIKYMYLLLILSCVLSMIYLRTSNRP